MKLFLKELRRVSVHISITIAMDTPPTPSLGARSPRAINPSASYPARCEFKRVV